MTRSMVYTALGLGVPCTAAVINNPNLSERLLKLHGKWKSDIAKDMYNWSNRKIDFLLLAI